MQNLSWKKDLSEWQPRTVCRANNEAALRRPTEVDHCNAVGFLRVPTVTIRRSLGQKIALVAAHQGW